MHEYAQLLNIPSSLRVVSQRIQVLESNGVVKVLRWSLTAARKLRRSFWFMIVGIHFAVTLCRVAQVSVLGWFSHTSKTAAVLRKKTIVTVDDAFSTLTVFG